ncbi:AI-2E family transporter [Dietzia aerolata]|uniref:AI-2E family transporter n=1 Tax=Dietzia aerolata TaxID=595984 RepID=UPI00363FF3C9
MTPEDPVRIAREHLPYPIRLAAAWAACLLLIVAGVWLVGRESAGSRWSPARWRSRSCSRPCCGPWWTASSRVPRALAAVVVVIGVIVAVSAAFVLVVTQLATGVPRIRDKISSGTDAALRWLEEGPLHVTADRLQSGVDEARGWLTHHTDLLATGAYHVGHTAVDTAAGTLICLVSLFFFLYQGEKLWMFFVRWLPEASRERTDIAFRQGWTSLGAYTHTQFAVAAINAAGVGIGALVLRVPFVIPIVVVVFLASFVPIVGTLIGGMVPTLLALVDRGLVVALIMLAIVVAVHLTESHVLQPLLMGHAVALHPLAVILVVAAGTYLFGVIGALFAVPITAMANSIVRSLVSTSTGRDLPSLADIQGPDHPHPHEHPHGHAHGHPHEEPVGDDRGAARVGAGGSAAAGGASTNGDDDDNATTGPTDSGPGPADSDGPAGR